MEIRNQPTLGFPPCLLWWEVVSTRFFPVVGMQTDPGATLLAGGNEVHAGPPSTWSLLGRHSSGTAVQ